MSLLMLKLFLVGTTVALLLYLRKRIKMAPLYELASKMPGPPTFPLVGDILTFAFDTDRSISIGMDYVKRLKGGPIRFWFFDELLVFGINPCDVEVILSNMKHLKKPRQYKVLRPFMGKGLFTNDNYITWRLHRKIITPAFHFNILKRFLPIFFQEACVFVKKVTPGKETDVFQMIGLCTLDIICRTAMGVRVESQSGKGKDFVQGMETLLQIAHKRLTRPWLINDTIFKYSSLKRQHDIACDSVLRFTENVIKEKKCRENNAKVNDNDKEAGTFLDLMIGEENENEMTDDELRDETVTIMIGGQETTTTEITFALLMLALHPSVQNKVLEEIDEVFLGEKTTAPTLENLQRLEYLERVIKEVMRLYPSIPLYGRVVEEDLDLNGYLVPKGCVVAVFAYATHRDPNSYPNPDKFDPDNFLPERCRSRSPFAYIPFSAGPRNCIGQKYAMLQLKTVISTILRYYRVSPGTNMKRFEDVEIKMTTTIKSKKPVRLIFTQR